MLSFNINIPSDVLLRIKLNVRFGSLAADRYLHLNVRFQYEADIRVRKTQVDIYNHGSNINCYILWEHRLKLNV